MNKNPTVPTDNRFNQQDVDPALVEQTFNGNLSAKPKSVSVSGEVRMDDDSIESSIDYGEMNLEDAIESGYTDENEHAVSMAKKDVEGSPTGAYTDIGAGRSSVVHHHDETNKKKSDQKH